jgi:hypothetical protein
MLLAKGRRHGRDAEFRKGSPPFTYFDQSHRDERARVAIVQFVKSSTRSTELINLIYGKALEALNSSF